MSWFEAGFRWTRWGLRRVGIRTWPLIYFETSLKDPPPEVVPGVEVSTRLVPSDEVLARTGEFEQQVQRFVRPEVEAGSRCYFAEHDGRLAAYSWVSPQAIRWGNCVLAPVVDRGFYSHTSYVCPEFRGKKLFQYLLANIYRERRDDGDDFLCNIVARNNAASIRVRQKLGAVGKPICLVYLFGREPRVWGGPLGTGELVGKT
jgi:GNAT superfamily N-acetyltransferase